MANILGQLEKTPTAVLDYAIDWTSWLSGDTIATSTWSVPSGITQNSATNTTTVATIWLSSGAAGQTYQLVNTITTAGGRTEERTIQINVQVK